MERNNSSQLLLSILGVAILVVAVVGVSFAFFTYSGQGATENTITTGTLTFSYTESAEAGNGIAITNAMPTEDSVGKSLTGNKNVFKFSVSGQASGAKIAYEVSALKDASSTLPETAVKLYLTKGADAATATTEALAPTKFSALLAAGVAAEKSLYKETISQTTPYSLFFELRMWIASDVIMGSGETPNADVQGKPFKVKINVNAVNA